MFFDLGDPVGTVMEELADHPIEEPTNQPMEEPVDQLISQPANPPIAPVDDVYYSIDDLMGTPPPDSQATAAIANWDSDWNLTSKQWF